MTPGGVHVFFQVYGQSEERGVPFVSRHLEFLRMTLFPQVSPICWDSWRSSLSEVILFGSFLYLRPERLRSTLGAQ